MIVFVLLCQGGKGPVLKYAGKDATRQFMMLHDRSVLIDHPGLCIGLLDESIAHSVAASPSGKGSETGEWVFGEWKPPAGAEKVQIKMIC